MWNYIFIQPLASFFIASIELEFQIIWWLITYKRWKVIKTTRRYIFEQWKQFSYHLYIAEIWDNCEWFLRFELKLYKPLMIEFRDVPLYASVRVMLSQLNFSNCCNKLDNFRMLTFQKYPTLIMQHKHVKKLFQNVSII